MRSLPSKADLLPTFQQLAVESCNGVAGVKHIKVGCPKQKVVLAAMTHGDEPAGLGAFRFILDNIDLLHDVELLLVIHNIDGGAKWFSASSWAEKHRCRADGWNFNRLPLDFPNSAGWPTALTRLRQLWRHVYPGTTYALDIHSADQPLGSNGVTLDIGGPAVELDRMSEVVPADVRFCGITPLQMGEGSRTKPVGTIFGGPSGEAVSIEVESDSHESPIGIKIAVETALAFLAELGCLACDDIEEVAAEQRIYDVLAATMVPSAGYRFVSPELLQSFIPIEPGQLLLEGPHGSVRAKNTGCLIFAPAEVELQPGDEKEEVCFELSRPRNHTRTIRLPAWCKSWT